MITIDGCGYEEHTNEKGKVYLVCLDMAEEELGGLPIVLRFKRRDHIVWSWLIPKSIFRSKSDLMNYLDVNTDTNDTMYVVSRSISR